MGEFNSLGSLDGQQPPPGGCLSVVFIFWLLVAIVWFIVWVVGSI